MSHAAPSPPPALTDDSKKKPARRPPPKLTTKQVCILRGDGHHLNPVVLIGKDGVTPGLCAAMSEALDSHGLIKIKVSENAPGERRELVTELATQLSAALVQVLGRTALLYREQPKPKAERSPAKAAKESAGAKGKGRSRSGTGASRTAERGRAPKGRDAGRDAGRRGPTSRR